MIQDWLNLWMWNLGYQGATVQFQGDPQLRRNQGPRPVGISQGSAASPPLLGRDCVDLLISLWRTAFGFMECLPLFSFYFYQCLLYLLFFLLAMDLFCSFSRLLKYKQGIWDLFFILLLILNAISSFFHSVQNIFWFSLRLSLWPKDYLFKKKILFNFQGLEVCFFFLTFLLLISGVICFGQRTCFVGFQFLHMCCFVYRARIWSILVNVWSMCACKCVFHFWWVDCSINANALGSFLLYCCWFFYLFCAWVRSVHWSLRLYKQICLFLFSFLSIFCSVCFVVLLLAAYTFKIIVSCWIDLLCHSVMSFFVPLSDIHKATPAFFRLVIMCCCFFPSLYISASL